MTRTAPDIRDIIRRGEELSHCRRLRHWLRASIIINIILSTALAGALLGAYSSSTGLVAPSARPDLLGGAK
jgi:hypothetical protein